MYTLDIHKSIYIKLTISNPLVSNYTLKIKTYLYLLLIMNNALQFMT